MTQSNSPTASEWRLKIALLLVSILISGAFAEVALRLLGVGAPKARRDTGGFTFFTHHPRLGWDLVPNTEDRLTTDEMDVTIRITEQGLRAHRTFEPEPAPGTRRIVVIGDSFSFGHGVEVEEAWPALLEDLSVESGRATEVINLSVTGYGTDQQLLRFEEKGLAWKPDVVMLGLFVGNIFRNARDVQIGYPKPRFVRRGGELELTNVPVPTETPGPGGSRLLSVVGSAGRGVSEHLGYGEAWDVTAGILQRLQERCREVGAELFVVIIPKDQVIYGSGQRLRIHQRTTRLAGELLKSQNLPYVDVSQALLQARDATPERLYFPVDGHWTTAGHRVAAETIFQATGDLGHRTPTESVILLK